MKVSVILPTYNNARTLRECLESLKLQDYKKNTEILVIDGGSSDDTLKIAKEFRCKIIKNSFRVEEKARLIGISKAKNELLLFIDADNVLIGNDFITKMVKPFEDKEIVASETLSYSYRKKDNLVTKYCSLVGGDDLIAIYLGIYDRFNYFKNKWTDMPVVQEKKDGYIKIKLDKKKIPAMGSNGFIIRKSVLKSLKLTTFIHTDIIYKIANLDHYFAKVPVSLVHVLFGISDFFKKKIRRIKRRSSGEIKQYDYGISKWKMFKTSIYFLLIIPIFYDMIKGFIRKPTLAWLFHPIAVYGTSLIYLYYFIIKRFFKSIF